MRKIILCLIAVGWMHIATAQSLKPYIKAGGGFYIDRQPRVPAGHNYGTGLGYGQGLSAGVVKDRWQLELSFRNLSFTSGRKRMIYSLDPNNGEIVLDQINYYRRHQYVMVPITVAYNLTKKGKAGFSPFVGLAFSYNYAFRSRTDTVSMGQNGWEQDKDQEAMLSRSNGWVGAGIEMNYQVFSRLKVGVSPEGWYMITDFGRKGKSFKQHSLMAGINISVRYMLD